MAKKRARKEQLPKLKAPSVRYDGGPGGLAVELRAGLPLPARARYHEEIHDLRRSTDDSWQRGLEFLWEQLGTAWDLSDAPITTRKELLGRYRMASQEERRFVRDSLRAHMAEYFPEMERPRTQPPRSPPPPPCPCTAPRATQPPRPSTAPRATRPPGPCTALRTARPPRPCTALRDDRLRRSRRPQREPTSRQRQRARRRAAGRL